MPDFPTLGVKFNLTDVVAADKVLEQVQHRLIVTGEAVAKFGDENAAAARDIKAESVATQGLVAELLLLNRTLRAVELQQKAQATAARLAGQAGQGSTQAARAAADAQLAIDRSLLTSRMGLNRQQVQDAETSAKYIRNLKIRYFAQEQADQIAASTALRRIAEADNRFLTALQNRLARGAPTTPDRLATYSQTAAARGLGNEAAPSIAGLANLQAVAAAEKAAAAEAKQAALDEARAATESARAQEQARLYLQGVKMRSIAWEQRAAEQLANAEVRAATRAANEQGRLAQYVQNLKIRYFTQAQRAQEASENATAASAARAAARLASQQASFLAQLNKRNVEQTNTTSGQRAYLELRAAQLGVTEAARPMIEGLHATEAALGHVSGQALKVRESFVLIRELMRGDFSRFVGSASILAGAFGALKAAALPLTLTFLGLAIVIGGVVAAMVKMENENDKLANALLVTNNAVGLTTGQIVAMGKALAESTGTGVSKGIALLTQLAATGQVSGESLGTVADAATRLSQLTGVAADKIGSELLKSFDDASKGAIELNSHYHFLTLAQFEQIDALQKAGDKQGAFNLLMNDLDGHLKTITPQIGIFATAWHHVTDALDGAVRAIGHVGTAMDNAEKLAANKKKLAAYEAVPGGSKIYGSQIKDLQRSIAGETIVANADSLAATRSAASDSLHQKGIDAAQANDAMDKRLKGNQVLVKQAQDDYVAKNAARLAANPNDPVALEDQAHMSQRLARIAKVMNPSAGRGQSLDATRNQVALGRAQITGLEGEISSASVNPLTEASAQINKAMGEAAAKDTFGKKSQFASQQAVIAGLKEEATLRLAVTKNLISQESASQKLADQSAIQRKADAESFGIMKALYSGADTNLNTYQDALDAVSDAQLKAKLTLNDYNIASQFGVKHVADISDAYFTAISATDSYKDATADSLAELRKHADALQTDAQRALVAANATDTGADADARATAARDKLTTALAAYQKQQKAIVDLNRQANLSPLERSAQSKVEEAALARVLTLRDKGIKITDEQAQADVRVKAVLDQQIEDLAKMKIGIQDSIRQGFVDTGKLDFKSLKDGVGKAIRQAVYDNLLAKPIDIVINAVMNIATDSIKSLLANVLGSPGSGSGGTGIFASILGAIKGSGTGSGAADEAAGTIAKATSGLSRTVGGLSSLLSAAGTAFIGSEIGSAGASALFGKPKNSTGAAIGGAVGGLALGGLGAAVGAGYTMLGFTQIGAMLGPIGLVVGAILGAALGGLIGGKESNHGAIASISGGSFSISGDKRNDDTTKLATALASAVIAGQKALTDSGIQLGTTVSKVDIGTRDPATIYTSDGRVLHSGAIGDAAAAADVALKAVLAGAHYVTDAQKALVDSMLAAGSSFDDIAVKLQAYAEAQGFVKGIDQSILKYKDPQAYALSTLQDQQIARRKQIQDYAAQGLISPDQVSSLNTKLKELEKLEITDTLSQFVDGVNGATASLKDFTDANNKIIEYVQGLKVGALSPLSPEAQLTESGNAFFAALNKASSGDITARQNITGQADTYLQQAQGFYGGTAQYSAIFDTVSAALTQLSAQEFSTSGTSTSVEAAVAALQVAIDANFAQLIGAVTDPANDNGATSVDVQNLQVAIVAGLDNVAAVLAGQTEALVQAQLAAAAATSGVVGGAIANRDAFDGGLVRIS